MAITGNCWLDLIEKEKKFRKEIESAVNKLVGNQYADYSEMNLHVKGVIRSRLENYGLKNHMGFFDVEYDIDLHYNNSFQLEGFLIKYIFINEEIF